MLNTYAAVLQAAFPDRDYGVFRSVLSRNGLKFVTSITNTFQPTVYPGQAATSDFQIVSSSQ